MTNLLHTVGIPIHRNISAKNNNIFKIDSLLAQYKFFNYYKAILLNNQVVQL